MDTIADIESAQRKERTQVRDDAELLSQLMAHKGWARYRTLVEAVAQNYYAGVMKPLDSSLEVVKVEFAKGVLSGLTLATSLPELKIREAQELRRNATEMMNERA